MFCEEPILSCYEGMDVHLFDANAYLDYIHELAYHVNEGCRLVLETEHHYIFLEVTGVRLEEKRGPIEELAKPVELFELFEEEEGYWQVLFTGQILLSVNDCGNYFLLQFSDFELKLIPHELDEPEFPDQDFDSSATYSRILGYESRLTKKCACGGNGVLISGLGNDFFICCDRCKRATLSTYVASAVIEEWNNGNLTYIYDAIPD